MNVEEDGGDYSQGSQCPASPGLDQQKGFQVVQYLKLGLLGGKDEVQCVCW